MLAEQAFIKLTRKHLKNYEKSLLCAAKMGFQDGLNGTLQEKPSTQNCKNQLERDELELSYSIYKYAFEKGKRMELK